MEQTQIAKIDLHCHSWASNRPSLWLMKRMGCPESFTSPAHVREIAMQRGMDFVVLTDHNTIDGVKEIELYDNVLRGNEVTTYFPGDVKVHVVVLEISDEQFQAIQEVRHDIFAFVNYLNQQDILHFCAHPMYRINGRLMWEHFEKLLLLFKRFEVLNGTRLQRMNTVTKQILQNLTKEQIERMAERYGIEAVGEEPWKKFVTGGTDDHSGLFVGTCYTEAEVEEMSKAGLLKALREGKTREVGANDGSLTLAHQVNSIAFQYYRSKITPDSNELLVILNRIFERSNPIPVGPRYRIRKALRKISNYFRKPKGIKINLLAEINDIISNHVALKSLFEEGVMTMDEYNRNVFNLTSDVFDQMLIRVFEKPKLLYYFAMFAPVVLSSYLFVCRNLHAERDILEQGERFAGIKRKPKAAWFTDSLVNMDGVSKTCRTFLRAAQERDCDLELICCQEQDLTGMEGVKNFSPLKKIPVPGYEKVSVFVPSVLQVVRYIEERDFDSIVISTPGPMGLLGLLCAKLIHLPAHGIYHTDFPRIALQVTGDPVFGELALHLTRLFYKHMEHVYAPCQWYIDDLINIGVEATKIRRLERWVNTEQFSPKHRSPAYWDSGKSINLLYVGRISKDKNIDTLIELCETLAPKYPDFMLHVVGDGPYFDEFSEKAAFVPNMKLTGAKFDHDLAVAYASSDMFVYPGLLDTFGNVVIEAQASGLPCVVMSEGGPRELIVEGETGLVAHSTAQMIQHVERLLCDEERRMRMKQNAGNHAQTRFTEERIFNGFWQAVTCKNGCQKKEERKWDFDFRAQYSLAELEKKEQAVSF